MDGASSTRGYRDHDVRTAPTMVISNNTSAILADEITNATADLGGLQVPTTGHYASLVYRLDLCQRMSPPPIPPWLMATSDKLRHLVANCSSWRKYTDLCSLHIPPEYPQALAIGSDSGSNVVQWIPFIIVLLIVTFIVVSVLVMYTLYRSNRIKCDILSDYQRHENFPRNYCLPHGTLTTSVTIETQLSVCALEDDSFASLPPLHLTYGDLAQSHRTQTTAAATPRTSNEILLHPASLEDADTQSPHFVSDCGTGDYYYSYSHSLPIIPDKGTPPCQHQQPSVGSDDEDSSSAYVHIHKRNLDASSTAGSSNYLTHVDENKTVITRGKDTVRGIVKRCRKAGAGLVLGVFGSKSNEGVVSSSSRPVTSLNTRFRRSFHSFQLKKPKPFRKSKSLEQEIVSGDISATAEPDVGLEVDSVHSPTNSSSKTGDSCDEKSGQKFRTARRMLKIINPLQQPESKGAKKLVRKGLITGMSNGDDCASLNQVFEPQAGLKSNKSKLKGIKMTNIIKKFNKDKAMQIKHDL